MDPTTANITMFAVSAHASDREAHVREAEQVGEKCRGQAWTSQGDSPYWAGGGPRNGARAGQLSSGSARADRGFLYCTMRWLVFRDGMGSRPDGIR